MKNTLHLQYKHSRTLANRKYEKHSYPKKSQNVRPHYSQSSCENATPSSGASPLTSYKKVTSPPDNTTLHYTAPHRTAPHRAYNTTPHPSPLHSTSLHYTGTLHYTTRRIPHQAHVLFENSSSESNTHLPHISSQVFRLLFHHC